MLYDLELRKLAFFTMRKKTEVVFTFGNGFGIQTFASLHQGQLEKNVISERKFATCLLEDRPKIFEQSTKIKI